MLLKKSILCGFIVIALSLVGTLFTGCTDNTNNTADEDETLIGTWISDSGDMVLHFKSDNMLYIFTEIADSEIVDTELYLNGKKMENVSGIENITADSDMDKFSMYKAEIEYSNYDVEQRDILEYNSKLYSGTGGKSGVGVYVDYETDGDKLVYTVHNIIDKSEYEYTYKIDGSKLNLVAVEDGYEINLTKDHTLDSIGNYLDYRLLSDWAEEVERMRETSATVKEAMGSSER